MTAHSYGGSELTLFAEARVWKGYWHKQIARYVSGNVLEVGAGTGNNTLVVAESEGDRWVCLEPDVSLCAELRSRTRYLARIDVIAGTLQAISDEPTFDTILYLDVLEHIETDSRELALSARRLKPGGHLIVLSPAHPWLYSPFDKSVGHFRRYTRATLASAAPADLKLVICRYLDCAGLAASSGNTLLLRQSIPTRSQILFWDRVLVPVSRCVDPIIRYRCGKSVLGIWRKISA